MPELKLVEISRSFKSVAGPDALRGLSLTIRQGEFVAIQGPSGGGKSTLLNILGLLDRATTGEYLVDETSVGSLGAGEIARLRSETFAFIFQSFHLLDYRPVYESVELGLLYRGVPRDTRMARAREALSVVGLAHLENQRANTLSGGERQRVAIARALATGAPIILADEPTGNLDSANSAGVVAALAEIHRAGATVVLVTHDTDVALHATRQIHIIDGLLEPESEIQQHHHDEVKSEEAQVPGRASTLRIGDLWRDSWRSIKSRKGRTAALVLAVAIGVALAVSTIGVSLSARAQVSDSFDARLNRDVTLAWTPSDREETEPDDLLTSLGSLSGVDAVVVLDDFSGHSVQASSVRDVFTARVLASYGDFTQASRAEVLWSSGHSQTISPGETILGQQLARDLALGPLDARPTIFVDGQSKEVVGLIVDSPRDPELVGSVVVAGGDVDFTAQPDSRRALLLTVAGAAQQVAKQAPVSANPFNPEAIEVTAPIDPADLRNEIENSVQTTLTVVTAISLLGAVIGLTNAMVLSVGARKHEFGLRRALGARARHISSLVMGESVLIGLFGGAIGLFVALASILVVTIVNEWIPVFDLRLAPLAVLAGVCVGVIGGIGAALRATKIEPHLALRL